MEQETLFTASKWDILKLLSNGPKSPLQLAKLSNTSVANVSQQLRLLEMAGLVHSKRISNRDKGQPRLLYSLVGNHSFLISSSTDFVEKKFFALSEYNKVILKIWFLDDPLVHYFLEKAFWYLEDKLPKIEVLAVDRKSLSSAEFSLIILSEDSSLKSYFKKIQIKNAAGLSKSIAFNVKSKAEFAKLPSSAKDGLYCIYDPSGVLSQAKVIVEEKKK